MNPLENNDPLDALLQQENTYVADDGFTKTVMAALPPGPRRRRFPGLLLLGAAIIGSVAAAVFLPWNNLPPLNFASLFSLNPEALLPWLIVSMVVCSVAWAAVASVQCED